MLLVFTRCLCYQLDCILQACHTLHVSTYAVQMKGKSFDVGSKHSLGNTSLLYLCFGLLLYNTIQYNNTMRVYCENTLSYNNGVLCYQCAKIVELHNPGFLFSMMIRSKKLAPTMYFFDMIRKVHIFSLLIATDLISRVQS